MWLSRDLVGNVLWAANATTGAARGSGDQPTAFSALMFARIPPNPIKWTVRQLLTWIRAAEGSRRRMYL